MRFESQQLFFSFKRCYCLIIMLLNILSKDMVWCPFPSFKTSCTLCISSFLYSKFTCKFNKLAWNVKIFFSPQGHYRPFLSWTTWNTTETPPGLMGCWIPNIPYSGENKYSIHCRFFSRSFPSHKEWRDL